MLGRIDVDEFVEDTGLPIKISSSGNPFASLPYLCPDFSLPGPPAYPHGPPVRIETNISHLNPLAKLGKGRKAYRAMKSRPLASAALDNVADTNLNAGNKVILTPPI